MTRKTLNLAIAAALFGTLALVGCKKKEEPAATPPAATEPAAPAAPAPAPEPAPAPAATASVASVDLGNAIGADKKVTTPSTTFGKKDTIYAAVSTTTSDPAASVPGKLTAKWTFGEGDKAKVVNEESQDITFTGAGVTEFHISKPDGWPTGKYKLEVSLDGNVVQTKDFEVK
ncbi:hypothetical protein [Luteimonas panaciterrae]|uniref:hypothetical protein n=1 Tax=Luteimonas panaciterrae TaxID=363885 RepID=UPI001CF9D716|nr:hypothetical protein [Luteimonas panaciterrae]